MRSRKRVKSIINKKHLLIISLVVILIVLGILGYFFLLKNKLNLKGYNSKITINYKTDFKKANFTACYGNAFDCKNVKIKILNKIDTSKLGKQKVSYELEYNGKKEKITQEIEIVDNEKPKIKIESATVCPNNKINEVKFTVTDNFDGDITNKAKVEYKDKKIVITVTDSNKNTAEKSIDPKIEDKDGPVIELKGNSTISLRLNDSFQDEGATATDKCDGEVKVSVEGNVNTSVAGGYTLTYKAKDSSGNESKAERIVNVYDVNNGDRVVYLTFDDGPSAENTGRLLDVLKKYDVKATFFVTGNGPDELIKREFDEGHSVALHTNSHVYSYVYSSVENYFDDLNAVSNRVERITGQKPTMIRFPGGSSNLVSADYDGGIHIMSILTEEVEKRGYQYYDWNVSSGDAGGTYTSDGVYNNVISTLKEGSSVVLQHDIKDFSVDAVERIIQYGQANGYTFEKLTPASPKAHHGVNN